MTTKDEWMVSIRNNYYPWMSDNQFKCFGMICDLVGGEHHLCGKVKECGPNGIEVNCTNNGWSTYDFNLLTNAVIMAHDRMIRFEIKPSGPGMLKLLLHKRSSREGRMYEKHPTMEDAINRLRS